MTINTTNWNSKQYWQGINLRNKYLKLSAEKPCIQRLPKDEKNDLHIVAEIDSVVIGTLMLSKKNSSTVQVKQVAIDESFQGNGLGKELLFFAEELARKLGFSTVYLTGRSQAWGFYEKFGYRSLGQSYYDGKVLLKKYEKAVEIEASKELLLA